MDGKTDKQTSAQLKLWDSFTSSCEQIANNPNKVIATRNKCTFSVCLHLKEPIVLFIVILAIHLGLHFNKSVCHSCVNLIGSRIFIINILRLLLYAGGKNYLVPIIISRRTYTGNLEPRQTIRKL